MPITGGGGGIMQYVAATTADNSASARSYSHYPHAHPL
jgi:predicted Rossmann-fold nucleotide-binding protein